MTTQSTTMRGLRPRTPAEEATREELLTQASGHARMAFAACLTRVPLASLWDLSGVLNERVFKELKAGRVDVADQLLRRVSTLNTELLGRLSKQAGGQDNAY